MKIDWLPDSPWEENRLNRRGFLKIQLKGAMWMAVCASGILIPKLVIASTVPDLGIAKGDPGPATRAAVELLDGMKAFIKKGSKVVIKPNMSFNHPPEEATITQTLAVENTKEACKVLKNGMVHALVDSNFYKPAEITTGLTFKNTDVMRDVLEADVLIAAPVAKFYPNRF